MVWPASHRRVFHLMSQQLNNGRQAHVRNAPKNLWLILYAIRTLVSILRDVSAVACD